MSFSAPRSHNRGPSIRIDGSLAGKGWTHLARSKAGLGGCKQSGAHGTGRIKFALALAYVGMGDHGGRMVWAPFLGSGGTTWWEFDDDIDLSKYLKADGVSVNAGTLAVEKGTDAMVTVKETGGAEFRIKAATSGTVVGHTSEKNLWFTRDHSSSASNADMTIAHNGNVGIAMPDPTVAPSEKLEVHGNIKTTANLLVDAKATVKGGMDVDAGDVNVKAGQLQVKGVNVHTQVPPSFNLLKHTKGWQAFCGGAVSTMANRVNGCSCSGDGWSSSAYGGATTTCEAEVVKLNDAELLAEIGLQAHPDMGDLTSMDIYDTYGGGKVNAVVFTIDATAKGTSGMTWLVNHGCSERNGWNTLSGSMRVEASVFVSVLEYEDYESSDFRYTLAQNMPVAVPRNT